MVRIDEFIQQPGQREILLKQAIADGIHVAIPGEILAYDSSKRTAKILPLIRARNSIKMPPVLTDVPVFFPGKFTYNISEGDECLVVFADNCIDSWHENSGVSNPNTARSHDMSDGFAFVGFRSKKNVIEGTNLDETLQDATEQRHGLMSASDKYKLNHVVAPTVFYRQFWANTDFISITLSNNEKTYMLWSAGSSSGSSGAMMDSTSGSLVFVSNGKYAIMHKGSDISITESNGTLSIASSTNIAMGIVEL